MIDRRTVLLALVSAPPLFVWPARFASAAGGAETTDFIFISRIITGSDDLTDGAAERIEQLLRERDPDFDTRLAALLTALSGEGTREQRLAFLDGDDLDFALSVARPWYLGYVGSPSGRILEDDAAFATFLETQAFAVLDGIVPRQSYPPGGAGWWQAAPEGVDASDLPAGSESWDYQPRPSYRIAAPDPAWRAYAAGTYDTLDAARAALARPDDGGTNHATPEAGGTR